MPRQPNGRPSIYPGSDDRYHTYVTVGLKPDGTSDRRHIKRRTAAAVADAVEELQRRVDAGGGAAPGKIETVAEWLTHWLENVVRPAHRQTTYRAYRSLLTIHAVPTIGRYRLDGSRSRLEPEHVQTLYAKMRRAGLAPLTVLKMHRTLHKAFALAKRQGKAVRNVCDLVDTPEARAKKIDAYDLDDAQTLLAAVAGDPMEARWLVGILLGPRQGEALGIRWSRVKLTGKRPRINLEKQLQRYTWQHGCADPAACAAPRCRRQPCGPSWAHGCAEPDSCKRNPRFCPARVPAKCRRHTRPCPAACQPGCARHAMHCPERVDGGLVEVDLKTEKSQRDLPLTPWVVEALNRRQARQMTECFDRGVSWDPQGLVFTTPAGAPVDPQRDRAAWRALVARAGVPAKRLHAARHTACSLLIATDTDISVVKELAGHTDVRMTLGYVDVVDKSMRKAVKRLEKALRKDKPKRSRER